MKLNERYQVLLLAIIVLAVYYPALSAGFNSVDDPHIIAAYEMGGKKGFSEIFHLSQSHYYRPVIELTYYFDDLFWNMHPRFMHLENVLLHACNTLLVFVLAGQIAQGWGLKNRHVPLFSALLFAVHPINSESTIWIAGRTDPLAALFVLAALHFLFKCLLTGRLFYLVFMIPLFFLGVFTKEIALCLLPVSIFFTICWPDAAGVRKKLVLVLTGVAVSILLLMAGYVSFSSNGSITTLFSRSDSSATEALQTVITAIGFYLKKLVLPLPLNFAIYKISSLYVIPGIAFLAITISCIKKRSIAIVLLSACVLFLLPALIVSVKQIAWTPFAERYLYLPSAFFCIGITGSATMLSADFQVPDRVMTWVVICIVSSMIFFTIQREIVWHDNLALYQDTVKKSPDFGAAHFELATILVNKGRLREGRAELEIAEKLNMRPSIRNPIKVSLMAIRMKEGDYRGAREYFNRTFPVKKDAEPDFLRLLNNIDETLANQVSDVSVKKTIYLDMLENNNILYNKSGDPFLLYQNGTIFLKIRDNASALDYMRRVVREAPGDTHYTEAAKKMVKKLESLQ